MRLLTRRVSAGVSRVKFWKTIAQLDSANAKFYITHISKNIMLCVLQLQFQTTTTQLDCANEKVS